MTRGTQTMKRRWQRIRESGERGVALLTTMMVLAVLTGLATTAAIVSMANTRNADRDRQAGGALNITEAGIAQGVAYIRKSGSLQSLTCPVPSDASLPVNRTAAGCTTANPWANPNAPYAFNSGNQTYRVWIGTVQSPNASSGRVGTYRIYATGSSGSGPGARTIWQDVQAKPFPFPIGIYSEQKIDLGGTGGVYNESVFSNSCIDSRNKITFTGLDNFYQIPAAAHSTSVISTSNNGCSATNSIHSSSACSAAYPYDQDGYGGPLAATGCYGSPYPTTSKFTLTDLQSTYGYKVRGLTQAQYDALRTEAIAQHHYYDASNPDPTFFWPCWTTAAVCPNGKAPELTPVVFVKDPGTTNPPADFGNYGYVQNASCTGVQPYIVLVVEQGSLTVNGGQNLTGNVFVPDGTFTLQGGASLYGSAYGNTIKQTGGGTINLPECVLLQFSPLLQDVTPIRYHEDDR